MSDFKEIFNPFSEYILPDGRRTRIRHVLTTCIQTGIDETGNAIYQLSFTGVCVTDDKPAQALTGWPLIEAGIGNRVALGPHPSQNPGQAASSNYVAQHESQNAYNFPRKKTDIQ